MYSLVSRSTFRSATRATVTGSKVLNLNRPYSTMHDNDPELLEKEKHRNLSGEQLRTPHIDGAPGWNEHLASAAEANIKADRHGNTTVEDMQRKTVDYIQIRHSPDERLSSRESNIKDEVDGPLSLVYKNKYKDGYGYEESNRGKTLKKKVVHEENVTDSEVYVRADRGDFDKN